MTLPRTARSMTIPPPVMGWNTRDPISQMDPLYAVELENYFPNNGVVALRNGYRQHATGVGSSDQVGTLAALEYASVSKLMAIADGKCWDVSSAGAATDITGGLLNIGNSSSIHQFRDRLFFKDSTVFGDVRHWTGSGNIGTPAFTGPSGDDKDLYTIGSYRSRIYFAQLTAPSIWYGGADAISGALTEFSLTSILKQPHSLLFFIGSIGRAKQYGEEEIFCVITDFGEVLLYGGSYPGGADWQLLGRHQIPKPISPRAFFYAGSDLLVATQLGVASIKQMIGGGYEGVWPLVNTTIKSAFSEAFPGPLGLNSERSSCAIAYPKGDYLLVNYEDPTLADTTYQLVMNTTTGAWTKFSGQQAFCWAVWNNELYFGGYDTNKVFKADNGYFDEDPASAGNPQNRTCVLRPAYNYLDNSTHLKAFRNARVIMYESEGLNLTLKADVDFEDVAGTVATTDTTDTSYKLYRRDVGITGIGRAVSLRMDDTVTTKRRSIQAIQIDWEPGGLR